MVKVPPEIDELAARCELGETPRVRVRKLLEWFSVARRGASSIAQITLALRAKSLTTTPDFGDAWIDEEVCVHRFGQTPNEEPEPVTDAPPEAPSTEPAVKPAAEVAAALVVAEPAVEERVAPVSEAPPSVSRRSDAGYRFGSIDLPSRRQRPFVLRGDPLSKAVSEMRLSGASVLMVSTNGPRHVNGVLTWEIIARALFERPANEWTVNACLERFGRPFEAVLCSGDDELLAVAARVRTEGYACVRDRDGYFVVTLAELGVAFGERLEPFLLATEIETMLRRIVEERIGDAVKAFESTRRDGDEEGGGRGARLTMGAALYLLDHDERWSLAALGYERRPFVRLLNRAREARNNLVHVNPEGVEAEDIAVLRRCVNVLRDVLRQPL